jgi:hypothetical protein
MSEVKEPKERSYSRDVDYKKINEEKRYCNEQVIQEIAANLDLSYDLVKSVVDAQSKFTSNIIKGGGLETIVMPYLGKFKVSPTKIQKMMAKGLHH